MNYRKFGNTDLLVSETGFGAWGIGGAIKIGNIPIGWGETDDETSQKALLKAYDMGVNFYDTADFYGLGRSEEIIGKSFRNVRDVIIATKVGHRVGDDDTILLDYSKSHIISACEKSLKRLQRNEIDLYQLHSAKVIHLQQGECIEAMERLKEQGKIRYWGISLNTFDPYPEYDFLKSTGLCSSYQVVFNIINQKALDLINDAEQNGSAVIARMVIQFGLLTGKMNPNREFESTDHRSFRLTGDFISLVNEKLKPLHSSAANEGMRPLELAMSFPLWQKGISTIIPGIKTESQTVENINAIRPFNEKLDSLIKQLYRDELYTITELMKALG
ncbi:MAG: aldo/keto reductase [Bacteroidetes bacterium]|nr:aldo/keto reductase [Bacteroidota bacterium]